MNPDEPKRPARLRDLRNLGPASEAALIAAGVTSPEMLDDIGPTQAYQRLLRNDHPPHRTMLWALAGALHDLDWRDLPAGLKTQLLDEIEHEERPS